MQIIMPTVKKPQQDEMTLTEMATDRILLIETATELCSVALSEGGMVTAYRESSVPKSHASLTAVFIDEVLKERELKAKDLSAVCVSEGPGSYTGLRVGVSTAKGLCFGAQLPLLSVGTLEILAAMSSGYAAKKISGQGGCDTESQFKHIVPMIDARRMEVYTAIFSGDGRRLTETEAKIIDNDSFSDLLEQGPVLFIGDGAGKCENVIVHPNANFVQVCPKASAMAELAGKELKEKRFKDVAYFEPFYLKEFVATVSKKRLF